jgi:hypothetical protein
MGPAHARGLFFPLVVAASLFLSSFSFAQASYTAQIRGVVSDQTGAVIANATVTITNIGTNASTVAKTDAKGLYLLPGLRPDTYIIKAEAAGFRAQEKKDIALQVDQQTTINFGLSPGGVITTVEVTTAPPLLDTESAALGTVVPHLRDNNMLDETAYAVKSGVSKG